MATHQADVQELIRKYIAAQVISRIRASAVLTRLVNSDFDDSDIKNEGDTIKVPIRDTLTVRDKVEGTPITSDSPETQTTDVVLNKHKYVSWAMGDLATSLASGKGIDYFTDAADQLIEAVESELLAEYASVAAGSGTPGTNLTAESLLDVKLKLDNQRCPKAGRTIIVSNKDENALLSEDKIVRADQRGDGGNAFENAQVGRIYGFNVMTSPLVPALVTAPRTAVVELTYDAASTYTVSIDGVDYTEAADTNLATTLGKLATAIGAGASASATELTITTDDDVQVSVIGGAGTINVTVTPASVEHHGLAFGPGALALVSRPLQAPPAGVETATITDAETGITLRYVMGWDINNMETTHVMDILFGTKVIDQRKIVDVVS